MLYHLLIITSLDLKPLQGGKGGGAKPKTHVRGCFRHECFTTPPETESACALRTSLDRNSMVVTAFCCSKSSTGNVSAPAVRMLAST